MKNKETKTVGYRLRLTEKLTEKELEELHYLSEINGVKISDFLRILIEKYKDENECFYGENFDKIVHSIVDFEVSDEDFKM